MTVYIKNIKDIDDGESRIVNMEIADVRALQRKDYIHIIDGKTRIIKEKLLYFCREGNLEVLDYVELIVQDI